MANSEAKRPLVKSVLYNHSSRTVPRISGNFRCKNPLIKFNIMIRLLNFKKLNAKGRNYSNYFMDFC